MLQVKEEFLFARVNGRPDRVYKKKTIKFLFIPIFIHTNRDMEMEKRWKHGEFDNIKEGK